MFFYLIKKSVENWTAESFFSQKSINRKVRKGVAKDAKIFTTELNGEDVLFMIEDR